MLATTASVVKRPTFPTPEQASCAQLEMIVQKWLSRTFDDPRA